MDCKKPRSSRKIRLLEEVPIIRTKGKMTPLKMRLHSNFLLAHLQIEK
ncbi:hypothetical protein COOONC_23427 [Cooperia oncophora]